MKDAIGQELQAGNLVAILGSYRKAGIVTGATPGGKIKFCYPRKDMEYRDWDEERRVNITCTEREAQGHTYCEGHDIGWVPVNSNKVQHHIVKITPEQLEAHVMNQYSDLDEDGIADYQEDIDEDREFMERILEMHNAARIVVLICTQSTWE